LAPFEMSTTWLGVYARLDSTTKFSAPVDTIVSVVVESVVAYLSPADPVAPVAPVIPVAPTPPPNVAFARVSPI
jgi:hypothetical protein